MRHPERLLSLALLAAFGCQSDRPKPVAPEVAMQTFNNQMAVHCPTKQVSSEQLDEFTHDYYRDADTQSQQLISQDQIGACHNGSKPECENAGFLQAEIQAGGLDEIVKQVCNKR